MSDIKYQIHETVLRDIVDVLMAVKDTDEIEMLTNKGRSLRSAAAAAEKMTLVFPVIISKSVSIENASMVVKAIERKCATMLQILFSAYNVTDAKNAEEFISRFHTNINFSSNNMTIDSFIDTIDKIANMDESGIECINPQLVQAIKEEMKSPDFYLPATINETSISNYKIMPDTYRGNRIICETPKASSRSDFDKLSDDEKFDLYNDTMTRLGNSTQRNVDKNKQLAQAQKDIKMYSDLANTYAKASRARSTHNVGAAKDIADTFNNLNSANGKTLLPSDVKKANELVPTLMSINFISTGNGDEPIAISNVVIGIKAKMYPVDSQDMINHIKSKVEDTNWVTNLVRATTREISFWKDFVFAIDKAKLDAVSNSRRGSASKMWKVLERRALKSRINRGIRNVNDAIAITHLVLTQQEVEYLKKFESIDIEEPRVARALLEAYNLMNITIVDEAMEVCKFLYDTGDDTYETIAFGLLEREAADNSYKKMVNLMTKVAR